MKSDILSDKKVDMINIVDLVANEKGINRDQVIHALEVAIEKAAQSRYGSENDIRATIDRKTGRIILNKYTEIVANEADIENEVRQITIAESKKDFPDLGVGDFIVDELPAVEFGRIATQTAKQIIIQKVRNAERERQYNEFKDKVGTIVSATVKRAEYGNITLDLETAEGQMHRDETIQREAFKRGDRVRALIFDVRSELKGPQIFLSRRHPDFLAELFRQEVPEIYDGTIKILSVARDAGSRAKMIVRAEDSSIDPVGACVGMRGSRVQAVVAELQGEKIDIIEFSDNFSEMVAKVMQPATVIKVSVDDASQKITVVVNDDQLSLAIGRRGQNVRLASILLGYDVDIVTMAQENEKTKEESEARAQVLVNTLGIDEVIAKLLSLDGFASAYDIAQSSKDELTAIEGISDDVALSLIKKSIAYVKTEEETLEKELAVLKFDDNLVEFLGDNKLALVALGKAGVLELDDLADLSSDELLEILSEHGLTESEADDFIIAAREVAGWFDDEVEEE